MSFEQPFLCLRKCQNLCVTFYKLFSLPGFQELQYLQGLLPLNIIILIFN